MKKITNILLMIFLLGGLSCSKEDTQINQEKGDIDNKPAIITITAHSGEESDGSKTIVAGENFNEVHWNANEKIAVFYNGKRNLFTSTNTSVSSIVDFSGTIDGITDPSQLEGKEVIGLYPYYQYASINGQGVVTTTLPSVQTAVDDTFADNLFISMGKSTKTATSMKFYNVCSGLCFTVSHNDIKTVVLRGANGEKLAGDFTVKFTNVEGKEVPVIQSIGVGSKNSSSIITVEAPNGGTFTPGKRYYVVSLTQSLPNGLIIEGFKADGTVYTNTINKNVTLKRAVFARKTLFDAGLTAQDLYDYTLSVIPPAAFPYTGGTHGWENPDPNKQGMKVVSYRTLKSDPTKHFPIAWKTQITIDDGATWNDLTEENKSTYGADWLTLTCYSHNKDAGYDPTNYTDYPVTVEIAESGTVDVWATHTIALKGGKHPSGIDNSTKDDAIDLSMYDLLGDDIAQTTANCYIVKTPGWYKFPMVYGNAIKDGATNTNSFTSTATQVQNNQGNDAVLMNFVDHNGANITQPWVSNAHSGGKYTISKAELVWQDGQNLVTNISVGNNGSEKDYIFFYIDKATIQQGNAVIAAYVGSTVAWSWHIWVTDQDMTAIPVKNFQNEVNNFLPVNIGWSESGTNTGYAARMAEIRIVQTIGTQSADCDIIQNGYSNNRHEMGNAPFYQWGRKDPMLPSIGTGNTNKTWYDKNGNASTTINTAALNSESVTGVNAIKNYIKNPFTFNTYRAMDIEFYNLWSANTNQLSSNTNNSIIVKTVYDPSPIDYSLPRANAYSGFLKNGGVNSESGAYTYYLQTTYNIEGGYINWKNGWYFLTNMTPVQSIFFPGMGYRDRDGVLNGVGNEGWYNGTMTPGLLIFRNNQNGANYTLYPGLGLHPKASGRAIRPALEL